MSRLERMALVESLALVLGLVAIAVLMWGESRGWFQ